MPRALSVPRKPAASPAVAAGLAAALLLLLAPGPRSTAAEATATALSLPASVQVDGSGIHLDQLLTAPSLLSLPHVRLANAPAIGQTASYSRTQVADHLRQHCPELSVTNLEGASAVRVTRRTRMLDETALKDLLTATLQRDAVKDRGELELRFSRAWTPVIVPDDNLSLRVLDLPSSGLSSSLLVRFELFAGTERLSAWQMVAQAKIWRDVLVARTTTRRGVLLRDADLTTERRDILTVREALPIDSAQDASLEFSEALQPGQPVLARSVRVRPVILRGQLVEAFVRDGGLTITLKVEALEDGLPGQTVRVRNPKTRREFLGKVHNEQTILVLL